MGVKEYKPVTAGRRQASVSDFSSITRSKPEKSLTQPKKKTGGRNVHGRATCRCRGGGSKQKYRVIDFRRDKHGIPATVTSIEYDPNRSARIALLMYGDGERRYILAPDGLKVGDKLMSGDTVEARVGNSMPLKNIPLGLTVHAVELKPGKGAQLARGAGTMVRLTAREAGYALLTLPSGEIRKVPETCRGTIGQVGNLEHSLISLGKAGRTRWVGRKPRVRGVAQNPVSHPMGGGEGRSAGGRHPCSPTGKPAKGRRTRGKRARSNKLIVRRRTK